MYIFLYLIVHFCYHFNEVDNMCYVTATDLKNNLSFYLEKSMEEDVYITKNNKVISVLVNPRLKAYKELLDLREELNLSIPEGKTAEDLIFEEIMSR